MTRKPNNWPETCTYVGMQVADDCQCRDCVRRREMNSRVVTEETKVDSKEGIEHLMRWAKAAGVVLSPVHAAIALKHGISTEGVMINRRIPKS